ncbi:hypothetical protein, partial [Streptomyces shenzhenensis]|uniref:hypothetical protein n=1 Tax=Streptomyces shenzhenensis TaxID=943815 RepID=UPI0036B178C0
EGVGLALAEEFAPTPAPVKMPVIASPMTSRRFPPPDDAVGLGVVVVVPEPEASEPLTEGADLDADGLGVALSSEPESGEEAWPDVSLAPSAASVVADGLGVSCSADSLALGEPEGDGEAEVSRAATQSLYSSAVRLFDDGGVSLLSARANVDVNPIPMRTAVGIATEAIALPAGMWNLVNSGFLGAA